MNSKTSEDKKTNQTAALASAAWQHVPLWRLIAMRCALMLTLSLLCLLCSNTSAKDVSGTIINQTWTTNESPYQVVGDILVAGLD